MYSSPVPHYTHYLNDNTCCNCNNIPFIVFRNCSILDNDEFVVQLRIYNEYDHILCTRFEKKNWFNHRQVPLFANIAEFFTNTSSRQQRRNNRQGVKIHIHFQNANTFVFTENTFSELVITIQRMQSSLIPPVGGNHFPRRYLSKAKDRFPPVLPWVVSALLKFCFSYNPASNGQRH